jgi:dTDP-4-dehydrorhamnose 3,5-epimerase-like enzyme
MSNNVFDCKIISLPQIGDRSGQITSINNMKEVPFDIKRIYYLYDVPGGESRGGHAHYKLQQLLVAASGSFDVIIDDGRNKQTFSLNRPNYGLYITPGIWRDLVNFSSGSVLLVLASAIYEEEDYIRTYEDFLKCKYE